MGGDVSQRSLRIVASYGSMRCVRQNHNETNNVMNIINDPANSDVGLLKDIYDFKKSDPNFRVCIVSQSSTQAMSINNDLIRRYAKLNIHILTGSDSGMAQKDYFEDISQTLKA